MMRQSPESDSETYSGGIIMVKDITNYSSAEEETVVVSQGNSVIKTRFLPAPLNSLNENLFVHGISPLALVCVLVICGCAGVISSLPYATYHSWITPTEWVFFCLIRTIAFALVFTAQWVSAVSYLAYMNKWSGSAWAPGRYIASGLFALLYSILYCIKWMELNNVIVWQLTIPMFTLSWFSVFYSFCSYRLGSSQRASTKFRDDTRKAILSCIKTARNITRSDSDHCYNVFHHIESSPNICLLVAVHINSSFHSKDFSSKLSVYEESVYDKLQETRSSLVDIFVGVSLVPVILALMEDYGYPIHKLCKSEGCVAAYDWIVLCSCALLGILYMVAVYDIHHTNMRKIAIFFRSKQDILAGIKKLILRLLPLSIACVVATTRLNASYSIFGKIAGKLEMPYSIGLSFIYLCVSIVFVVDMMAAYKITCRTYKHLVSVISVSIRNYTDYMPWVIGDYFRYHYLCFYYRRLSWTIKTCKDELLVDMCDHLI